MGRRLGAAPANCQTAPRPVTDRGCKIAAPIDHARTRFREVSMTCKLWHCWIEMLA